MDITVTLINNQYFTKRITVVPPTSSSPALVDYTFDNNLITIFLEDIDYDIDFSSIQGITKENLVVFPLSYDEKKGKVSFPFYSHLQIIIKDYSNNQLSVTISE